MQHAILDWILKQVKVIRQGGGNVKILVRSQFTQEYCTVSFLISIIIPLQYVADIWGNQMWSILEFCMTFAAFCKSKIISNFLKRGNQVIPAFRSLRQNDHDFHSYIVSPCLKQRKEKIFMQSQGISLKIFIYTGKIRTSTVRKLSRHHFKHKVNIIINRTSGSQMSPDTIY